MNKTDIFKSREQFEAFIPQRIRELTRGGDVLDASRLNAYPRDLVKAGAKEILPGRLSADQEACAMDFILDGGLLLQFLFAGAATRAAGILKGGSKYSFSLHSFLESAQSVLDKCRKEIMQDISAQEKDKVVSEITALEKGLKEFQDKDLVSASIGARQIIQYRLMLDILAQQRNRNMADVLKNIYFLVHINEDSSEHIREDFVRNDFFGFLKENVIFIVQQNFEGYVFHGREIEKVQGLSRPFGHGYNLVQTVVPGTGFIQKSQGSVRAIDESPLSYICTCSGRQDLIMANANVDDLTKLTYLILDLDRVHHAMKCLLENGVDVLVEGVWNKKGQKGGSWVRDVDKEKDILVEGLQLKTSRFNHLFMDEAGNKLDVSHMPLLNKMSNFYRVNSLRKWLPVHGLPHYLDIRSNVLFLESITGDITQISEIISEAFVKIDPHTKEPEAIKTFKGVNDVCHVLQVMEEQDKDTGFVRLAQI